MSAPSPAPKHPPATPTDWRVRWQRFSAAAIRGFHAYGNWLVGISWRRFIVLSVLLLISVAILKTLPPFHWSVTETIEDAPTHLPRPRGGQARSRIRRDAGAQCSWRCQHWQLSLGPE